ncbi:MAG: hypothetical protein B6D61_01665 [Bacteroidetes bacterium 4484_249]|nr:MAG: hypothetical protein B6D61_01665 [Bacteroidetes bacterium 4484_249]
MKTKIYTSEFRNRLLTNLMFLCIVLLFCIPSINFAQDKPDTVIVKADSVIYLLKLTDGTEVIGTLIEQTATEMRIATENFGEVTILKTKIKKTKILNESDFVKGEYWFENPNSTRYFFAPSAHTLEPGEGYYQNTYLILQSFNVGITRNISFGGGFEITSLFGLGDDGPNPIFYLTPKAGFKVAENVRAGVGVLYATVPDDDSRMGLGIMYGITTYGNIDNNITLGLGWGYSEAEFHNRPVITLSGMSRISKRVMFVSENWIIPDGEKYMAIFSYGIRFFGERISVDLGFINNKDIIEEIVIGIPYVDFVVKFGK